MPRTIPTRLATACALALVLFSSMSLSLASGALAKGFTANLRVIGAGGKVLAEKKVSTATTSVKTSRRATCFGTGSGGSGKSVSIKGNTGLGLLAHAARTTPALKPLSISDHFDFGLALCGVGRSTARGSSSWYLKIDHKAQQVSGDHAVIHPGDEVLWALAKITAPSYKYPNDLALVAPSTATAGEGFTVHAYSYDEKGRRKPAAGVTVTGAAAPTGADGSTVVTLSAPALLQATKSGEIPSAKVGVCIGTECPRASQ